MEGERDGLWSVSLSSQVLEHFRGERREETGRDEDEGEPAAPPVFAGSGRRSSEQTETDETDTRPGLVN